MRLAQTTSHSSATSSPAQALRLPFHHVDVVGFILRVVVFLRLSRQLVKESLAMIRSQIPLWRKSMLEAYVDIVFRAWKAANGETREEISCRHMQALVDSSTHEQGDGMS
uniref:Uncharacterized protein n=1 Tax=Lactuca sativa TaxID=4236 RepID=A0A9R1UP00_LACSA|nr:hypothetical protein LSAT_V11C800446120 [Lactuca sativa]